MREKKVRREKNENEHFDNGLTCAKHMLCNDSNTIVNNPIDFIFAEFFCQTSSPVEHHGATENICEYNEKI